MPALIPGRLPVQHARGLLPYTPANARPYLGVCQCSMQGGFYHTHLQRTAIPGRLPVRHAKGWPQPHWPAPRLRLGLVASARSPHGPWQQPSAAQHGR
eukprot:1160904-Pelagomonas_calceolata.AAC.2